jgi:hypothetical protein
MPNSHHLFLKALALLTILISPSCDLINPDEDAPGYVEVKQFSFNPVPGAQEFGPSVSTKIKDAWVYIDGKFHGVYELPARFPVLETGNRNFLVLPGILLNGIAGTRSPYPFYKGSDHAINLPANGSVVINPSTEYFNLAECTYCESFEGAGFSLTPTALSDTMMFLLPPSDPDVFEGAGSGAAYLTTENSIFEVASTTTFTPPGSSQPVYLEMDYKINQEMKVGLIVIRSGETDLQIPIITLRPNEEWNKVYVQLGYTVSSYPNATFKLFIGALKSPETTKSEFFIDNIKVVNF